MILIKMSRVVDGLLACSALRGDITGRGRMLVDNDELALRLLLGMYVPAYFKTIGMNSLTVEEGWYVGPTESGEDELTGWLTGRLLKGLFGMTGMEDTDISDPGSCDGWIDGYF